LRRLAAASRLRLPSAPPVCAGGLRAGCSGGLLWRAALAGCAWAARGLRVGCADMLRNRSARAVWGEERFRF